MAPERKLLLLLSGAFVLDHMDRHILSITLSQIGDEFALNDLQLGLLSGLAFAVVFTLLAFPFAWATRPGRRKAIAVGALTAWSALTMAMAAAGGYAHLFLARMGVAVGEAGYTPAAHSMVADSFPEGRRASAFALFSAGANIGLFLAFLVGGVVAAAYGWRAAFLIAGAPGLLLALVLMRWLKEPEAPAPQAADGPTFGAVWRRMTRDRSTRLVLTGAVLTAAVNYGAIAWVATFLIRSHEMRVDQAGVYLALVGGLGGGLATFGFGVLADRLGARAPAWRLKVIALMILAAKLLAIAAYMAEGAGAALLLLAIPAMTGGVYLGPTFAHVYSRIAEAERPRATAIIVFLLNLVGLGLGPTFVGALSNFLSETAGPDTALAMSLAALQTVGILGAAFFFMASRR